MQTNSTFRLHAAPLTTRVLFYLQQWRKLCGLVGLEQYSQTSSNVQPDVLPVPIGLLLLRRLSRHQTLLVLSCGIPPTIPPWPSSSYVTRVTRLYDYAPPTIHLQFRLSDSRHLKIFFSTPSLSHYFGNLSCHMLPLGLWFQGPIVRHLSACLPNTVPGALQGLHSPPGPKLL